MKRLNLFSATLALAAFALAATLTSNTAEAQVTASSFSNGGTAISTAHGRGNTRLNASAVATGGGYARSTMFGSGRNGGFASGNSRAVSHGGVAISNGRSRANGWGARSHSNSVARTVGGFARSDSRAVARGNWANAASDATTRTWGTYGRSSAEAIDDRFQSYPSVTPSSGTPGGYPQNASPASGGLQNAEGGGFVSPAGSSNSTNSWRTIRVFRRGR
jgi:hypothetical protein